MEGTLEKKCPNPVKPWQKRYFLLIQDHLLYFKDAVVGLPPFTPKGMIPKTDIKKVDYLDPKKQEFAITVGKREIVLRAENQEIKEKWLDALRIPLDQKGKDKYVKIKWAQVPQDLKASIYLERERQLKHQIIKLIEGPNRNALEAKKLSEMYDRFGEKAGDHIFKAFIRKPSRKQQPQPQQHQVVRKLRWIFVINTLNSFNLDPIPKDLAEAIPQMYALDTLYSFKFEQNDDRTVYTKLKLKIYELEDPQVEIGDSFSVRFVHKGQNYQFYFTCLSEARKFQELVANAIANEKKLSESKDRIKQEPKYYVTDTKHIANQYQKGKVLLEGQLEKKINDLQWKNAVITLKEDYLYWLYVDCEQVEHIELFKLHEIEKSFRSFTVFTKKGEQLMFKSATPQEANEWCDRLAKVCSIEIRNVDVKQSQVPARPQLQAYQRSSLIPVRQSQQIKNPPPAPKPGFFDSLFCFGGERQPVDN